MKVCRSDHNSSKDKAYPTEVESEAGTSLHILKCENSQ